MTLVFLDSNVFLYAVGKDPPLRAPSQRLLRRVAAGEVAAITSTEVVQEVLYVLLRRGHRTEALALAQRILDLFPDLLPVTRADMARACALLEEHPDLTPRDAVHAATALGHGLADIVSADEHFAALPGIRWRPLA